MSVTAETVYEAFRRFLSKQLRVYDGDTIHVGESCGCLRKAWYTRKLGSKSFEHVAPSKRVIMGLGLSTHMVLEGVLREMGYETECPIVIDTGMGFKLAGTPDAVNADSVIEIKTCNRLPDEPFPHHVMQANAYLGLLGKGTAYIIYICKRDGNVRVFPIHFDERMYHQLLERAARLYRALKSNTPPPPEPSHLCQFCEWKWNCYLDANGGEAGRG